jgi:hypothetical protein
VAALIKQTLKKKKKDITSPSARGNPQEEQEDVDILQLLTSPSAKEEDSDDRSGGETIVFHGSSEGQKVLRVLYCMKAQAIHKNLISEFMYEHIFKDLEHSKNLFSLTFKLTYQTLPAFISYRSSNVTKPQRVFNTSIKSFGT